MKKNENVPYENRIYPLSNVWILHIIKFFTSEIPWQRWGVTSRLFSPMLGEAGDIRHLRVRAVAAVVVDEIESL